MSARAWLAGALLACGAGACCPSGVAVRSAALEARPAADADPEAALPAPLAADLDACLDAVGWPVGAPEELAEGLDANLGCVAIAIDERLPATASVALRAWVDGALVLLSPAAREERPRMLAVVSGAMAAGVHQLDVELVAAPYARSATRRVARAHMRVSQPFRVAPAGSAELVLRIGAGLDGRPVAQGLFADLLRVDTLRRRFIDNPPPLPFELAPAAPNDAALAASGPGAQAFVAAARVAARRAIGLATAELYAARRARLPAWSRCVADKRRELGRARDELDALPSLAEDDAGEPGAVLRRAWNAAVRVQQLHRERLDCAAAVASEPRPADGAPGDGETGEASAQAR